MTFWCIYLNIIGDKFDWQSLTFFAKNRREKLHWATEERQVCVLFWLIFYFFFFFLFSAPSLFSFYTQQSYLTISYEVIKATSIFAKLKRDRCVSVSLLQFHLVMSREERIIGEEQIRENTKNRTVRFLCEECASDLLLFVRCMYTRQRKMCMYM